MTFIKQRCIALFSSYQKLFVGICLLLASLVTVAIAADGDENYSQAAEANTVEAYLEYQQSCEVCADYDKSVAAIRKLNGLASGDSDSANANQSGIFLSALLFANADNNEANTATSSTDNKAGANRADEGFTAAKQANSADALRAYQNNCTECNYYAESVEQLRGLLGVSNTNPAGGTASMTASDAPTADSMKADDASGLFLAPLAIASIGMEPPAPVITGPDEGYAAARGNLAALRAYQASCTACAYYQPAVQEIRQLAGTGAALNIASSNTASTNTASSPTANTSNATSNKSNNAAAMAIASGDEAALYQQATSTNNPNLWRQYQNTCTACEHYAEAVAALKASGPRAAPLRPAAIANNSAAASQTIAAKADVDLSSDLPEATLLEQAMSGSATDIQIYQRNCVQCEAYAKTVTRLRSLAPTAGGSATGSAANSAEAAQIEQAIAIGGEQAFIDYQNNCTSCDFYAYSVDARRALAAGEALPPTPIRPELVLVAVMLGDINTDGGSMQVAMNDTDLDADSDMAADDDNDAADTEESDPEEMGAEETEQEEPVTEEPITDDAAEDDLLDEAEAEIAAAAEEAETAVEDATETAITEVAAVVEEVLPVANDNMADAEPDDEVEVGETEGEDTDTADDTATDDANGDATGDSSDGELTADETESAELVSDDANTDAGSEDASTQESENNTTPEPEPEPAEKTLQTQLEGHGRTIWAVDFSSTGKLASGSGDQTAKIWQTDSPDAQRTLSNHRGFIATLDFAGTGDLLATGSADSKVIVWDASTGEKISTITGFVDDVAAVSFSPDGSQLAIGDATGVALYDATSGSKNNALSDAPEGVSFVDFAPDGDKIAVTTPIKSVVVDTSGSELYKISSEREQFYTTRFSPDGRFIATGATDNLVRLYNADNGKFIRALPKTRDSILSLAFSPDGKWLAAGCADGGIYLYNVKTGRNVKVFAHYGIGVYSLSFSPDSDVLASTAGTKTIKLFDVSGL